MRFVLGMPNSIFRHFESGYSTGHLARSYGWFGGRIWL